MASFIYSRAPMVFMRDGLFDSPFLNTASSSCCGPARRGGWARGGACSNGSCVPSTSTNNAYRSRAWAAPRCSGGICESPSLGGFGFGFGSPFAASNEFDALDRVFDRFFFPSRANEVDMETEPIDDNSNNFQAAEQQEDQSSVSEGLQQQQEQQPERTVAASRASSERDFLTPFGWLSQNVATSQFKFERDAQTGDLTLSVNNLSSKDNARIDYEPSTGALNVCIQERRENNTASSRSASFSSVQRSVFVGRDINPEQIRAKFDNGVLSISVPHVEENRSRGATKIMVN